MGDKKRALSLFRRQLQQLDHLTPQTVSAWRSLTTDLIKIYLGPESDFINTFSGSYNFLGNSDYYRDDIPKSKSVLESCILLIEQNGIYKVANSNFISRMSEGWAIFWASCLVSVFGVGGYSIGEFRTQQRIDQQKIELGNEIKRLKAENSIFRMRFTNQLVQQVRSHAKQTNNK